MQVEDSLLRIGNKLRVTYQGTTIVKEFPEEICDIIEESELSTSLVLKYFLNYEEILISLENYTEPVGNIGLTLFLRTLKIRYEHMDEFEDLINFQSLLDFIKEVWESVEPITFKEAFEIKDINTKRLIFHYLGPVEIFKSKDPILINSVTIKKTQKRWNPEREITFNDTYELYKLDAKKLLPDLINERRPVRGWIYATRCWCPSSNKEHWIIINPNEYYKGMDGIDAICTTFKIDIANPVAFLRQGDILLVKHPKKVKKCLMRNITRKEYLNLLIAEA